MGAVNIRNLRKKYGQVEVLHGIDIDIADGEFVSLVGPSGCGKSTLLRMIAGLEDISSGDITISDRVVNSLAPKDRDIAMVFQSYALYPHMTVQENMAFALKLARTDKSEISRRVKESAEMLGLQPYLTRYPRQLSGGQRQRVAMGRAMVRKPSVFLFDEPLSNLDAKLRVQMRTEIKQNHQSLGTTTVYVTHDQIEAMTMADRIVVLQAGKIEQIGSPLDLYDRPANLFVAGFIGSPAMNMFEGTLEGGDFVAEDGTRIPIGTAVPATDGMPMTLGIRPEHLHIDEQGAVAEVLTVEPTGLDTQVVVRFADKDATCIFRQRVSARPGEKIRIRPELHSEHLFDGKTGERLVPTSH